MYENTEESCRIEVTTNYYSNLIKSGKKGDQEKMARHADYETEKLKKKVRYLESEQLEYQKQLNSEKFEKSDLKLKINELQDTIFLLEREIQDTKKNFYNTEKQLYKHEGMHSYLEEFKIQINQANPEIERCLEIMLREERLEFEKKMNEYLKAIQEKDLTIESVEREARNLRDENVKLVNELNSLRDFVNKLEDQLISEISFN